MAKKLDEITNRKLTVIPFKRPDKPKHQTRIFTPTCGCGAEAEYEVYNTLQPHCKSCMTEAMTSTIKPFVRPIGGFDDAS
ncbi:hypothetical protein [Paenibacillus sp. FSL L8-0494]|uniref:hypothetical protein n=1 Tax=Paenibacillus sp. FSL L8-0494 TaxID=2975352 RepID=UPI0030FAF95D